jgi:hypothetical protein
MKPFLTPEALGKAVTEIVTDPAHADTVAFRITGSGIQPVG